uniref:Uncharacterized protein n=1 Tax=Zea mays TaxID=4577 RepID=C4J275_MAIZE|nr:unknown [Zea mays]
MFTDFFTMQVFVIVTKNSKTSCCSIIYEELTSIYRRTIQSLKAAIASGLKSVLSPNTLRTSAGVNSHVRWPALSPQKSSISDTRSKFRMVDICESLENLSLTGLWDISEKWLIRDRTSLSSWSPPSWLNLFCIIITSSLLTMKSMIKCTKES